MIQALAYSTVNAPSLPRNWIVEVPGSSVHHFDPAVRSPALADPAVLPDEYRIAVCMSVSITSVSPARSVKPNVSVGPPGAVAFWIDGFVQGPSTVRIGRVSMFPAFVTDSAPV